MTRPTRPIILVSLAIGSLTLTGCGGDTATSASAETVTTTTTATVTVTEEAEPTASIPQACLDALDSADVVHDYAATGFQLSGEAMDAAAQGFGAAAEFDIAGIEQAGEDMTASTEEMNELAPLLGEALDEYRTLASACRAAS